MEEAPLMAVGLLQEAQARARYRDDWERDDRVLQASADRYERMQAIKAAMARIVHWFRRPTTPGFRAIHA
jgi:hypothetical protein